ncbi:MAG: hypothetical protein JO281_09340 [Pseudonocardiales bacterium]|nr:hypothetical protein [Pseudonocardiales bacterium]
MSKRTRREKRNPAKRRPGHGQPTQQRTRPEEPDLMGDVAAALADDHPLTLISLVSSLLAALEPRRANPFEQARDPGLPTRDELVRTFLEVDLLETSALLAVIAELSGDDILRRRVRREITKRVHVLPGWLTDLGEATIDRVVEMVHVLGDGDNIMIGMSLPGGSALSLVVYIDHNMGTLVKDAFAVPEPLDALIEHMRLAGGDPDTTWADLALADARMRIREALERSAIIFPPFETASWPGCRPLLEWTLGMLPAGGTGYQRPHWNADALAELTERFLASPFGTGLDDTDHRSLLESVLWFGTDYGPGDPLRWSPVAVEILLTHWIPRKIAAGAAYLAKAPDLLRAFIRFSHHERGIRAALTANTLAAVDEYEPQYQRTIRSPWPPGPAALLAAMGALHPDGAWPLSGTEPPSLPEMMLDTLRRAVGGENALDKLDAAPLPDEPFAWAPIPVDIHERVSEVLRLVDRCCDELLDVEYRTACRRYLSRAAAADPEIFRRRGRAETAAAAICWGIGKANDLFGGKILVKDLLSHFGIGQGSVSQRSAPLLSAIGVDPHHQYGEMNLGSPDYLTSVRRQEILAHRDHYRAMRDAARFAT